MTGFPTGFGNFACGSGARSSPSGGLGASGPTSGFGTLSEFASNSFIVKSVRWMNSPADGFHSEKTIGSAVSCPCASTRIIDSALPQTMFRLRMNAADFSTSSFTAFLQTAR